MGMCNVFKIQKLKRASTLLQNIGKGKKQIQQKCDISKECKESVTHRIDIKKFMVESKDLCIYDSNSAQVMEIVEYAPELFKEIRENSGVSDEFLFNSFAPIYNYQAIHNFFQGDGKSESFFFFTDNKEFVLKTLKESERKLLFEGGILEKYAQYLRHNKKSLLSRFYGVYLIKIGNMQPISCFLMNNLFGKDFIKVQRLYDLKGSTHQRETKLTEDQIENGSGLKCLKDMNFIKLNEGMDIDAGKKKDLNDAIALDA